MRKQDVDSEDGIVHTIVVMGEREVTVGRSRSCTVTLSHVSVGRQHACLRLISGNVEIEDLNSRFGTAVNGTFVRRTRLKTGDLVRFGSAEPYRLHGTTLRVEPDSSGLGLALSGVTIERNGHRLLDVARLKIVAGSFVGLLGPSGAGKSLLLGCLATTLESGGSITFDDGKPLSGANIAYYRSKLGLVPQEDLVYGSLTVAENIQFAAQLRMENAGASDIEASVERILADVGLNDHRHKLVSVLAGGQRKRVSVAIELLTRPRLLLLDEPTSGLDPGMQARIMDMLRGLARQGITIVTSTHTMDTLHFFDSVVVLAPQENGTGVAFQGSPSELLPAFAVHDTADLFDVLARGHCSKSSATESKIDNDASGASAITPDTVTHDNTGPQLQILQMTPHESVDRVLPQSRAVFRRTSVSFLRDVAALRLAAAQPCMLALLIVVSQANQGRSTFIHFFLVVAAIWMGMTLTVREIVRERSLYLRDKLAGLSPQSYLLGKSLFGIGFAMTQAILMFLFARMICPLLISTEARPALEAIQGIYKAGDSVSISCLILGGLAIALAAAGGALIGLTVSSFAKSEQFAVLLLPLIILPQMLLSRVAGGDASRSWGEFDTPYTAIADARASILDKSFSRSNAVLFMLSVPMLSRPSCAALDMLHLQKSEYYNPNVARGTEWLYLVLAVVIHGMFLYLVFMHNERSWRPAR